MKKSLQIVLMGWEWDRIIYGLKQNPPNKVILICPMNEKSKKKWGDITVEIANKVVGEVGKLLDTEIRYADYYDFFDCMRSLSRAIEENVGKYDSITINISTGTRILSTAAVLVSQYFPVELLYVVPEKYNISENMKYLTSGAKEIVWLPTFNIKSIVMPVRKQKWILDNIEEKGTLFSDMIKKYCRANNTNQTRSAIAKLRSVLFYNVKKLKDKHLIETEIIGNKMMVKLTDTGKLLRKLNA